MAIPDWLSIQEISRLWGEETGHDLSAFQKDLEEWFAEFVKEPPTSRQLAPGVTFDTIIANRLLGMLGARYLERKTFEAYCEDCGHSKPRFWFAGWEAERDPTGPSLEQPQQELTERPAAASAQAAELKVQLEAAERRGSVNYRDPQTNSQPLRQTTARQKRRGRAILVAGLAVPLVALFFWGAATVIQFTETAALPFEPAAVQLDLGGADLRQAGLPQAPVGVDPLAIAKQEVETARQTTSAEAMPQRRELMLAVTASSARMAALRRELKDARQQINDLSQAAAAAEDKAFRLREELAARQQEAAATQLLTGSGATAPSDQIPVTDHKDPDQAQDTEDVEAAPEIEEILTAAEISSDPVTSEMDALRDTVSPDDLLLEPGRHVDREVMVTGSVMWLLRRYWLQSDSGHMSMLIDVQGLQSDERNKLKDAVVQIEYLAKVRARITGKIERQGSENYRLAATELVLVE